MTYSIKCLNCENPVSSPGGKFCSRSCSAIVNNKKSPKRRPQSNCKKCNDPVKAKAVYCLDCRDLVAIERQSRTLGELRSSYSRDSVVYNLIRAASRIQARELPQHCIICGYNNHVEVAHLFKLSELPDETTFEEASSSRNFILLCPNHHWEFDYGDLLA